MKKLYGLVMSLALGLVLLVPAPALADHCSDGQTHISVKVSGSNCVKGLFAYLNQIIRFVEGMIGVGIVLAIVIAGVQYITSAGSPEGVKSAKSRLSNALIGLVLYLLLVAIIEWLGIVQVSP